MEEAEHRHLRDELLDAAAEPVKDMVSLHLEWCVGHSAAATTPARSGSSTRREDTAELLLRVLHCAMRAANVSRVGKYPFVGEEGHQILLQGLPPDLRIMVNSKVWKGC